MRSTIKNLSNFIIILIIIIQECKSQKYDTNDCGSTYKCFVSPDNCENTDCEYVIKYKDNNQNTDFMIASKLINSNSMWLGIGFSYDQIMGNDSVKICKYSPNLGVASVEHYFNSQRARPSFLVNDNPTIGISNAVVSANEGYLICSFSRAKKYSTIENYFDLNNDYYLLIAKGALNETNFYYHFANRISSSEKISFVPTSSGAVNTNDCGKDYGCFRIPDGCENTNCNYIAKWKNSGDDTEFILNSKVTSASNSWLAIGFSNDQSMGDDTVVMCKYNSNGNSLIQHYYNVGKKSEVLANSNPTIGISQPSVSLQDGFFSCSFKRQKKNSISSRYFDLNNPYYILLARGLLDGNNVPQFHSNNKLFSSSKIDFNSVDDVTTDDSSTRLVKAHGALMCIAWILIASTGILFARYFKFIFPEKKYCDVQFWFTMHRGLMASVPIISIIGLLLVLAGKKWTWVSPTPEINFAHSILGILTISSAFFQPIMAYFRPDKNAPRRPLFNFAHRTLGLLGFYMSIVSILLAMIFYFENVTKAWAVFVGWIVWIVLIPLLLELADNKINHLDKDSDTKNEKSNGSMKFEEINKPISNKLMILSLEKYKSFILLSHIVITFIFTVALIVLISIR